MKYNFSKPARVSKTFSRMKRCWVRAVHASGNCLREIKHMYSTLLSLLTWKVKKSAVPLISKTDILVTMNKVLRVLFTWLFNGNLSSHTSQVTRLQNGDLGSKVPPTLRENLVGGPLRNLSMHLWHLMNCIPESWGNDLVVKPLSMKCHGSQQKSLVIGKRSTLVPFLKW